MKRGNNMEPSIPIIGKLDSKWVSVKVRYPKPDVFVLLAEIPDSTRVHVGCVDDEGRFWIYEAKDVWPSQPTHWLSAQDVPLPK